jgi:hypothetical protein
VVIETVDVALRAYSFEPASEPMLTDSAEIQDAIRGVKISKTPGPDCIPNRNLKHLTQRMFFLLMALLIVIFITQYFPPVWKHPRVISILKHGKDPAQSYSYQPISLLDTIGKLLNRFYSVES